jgi:MoaA/NifB/PqqE/SkfB family radical SAM enzyme
MRVDCVQRFTHDIRTFFQRAKQVCSYDPALRLFVLQTMFRQRRADRLRRGWKKKGVRVPPFISISVTRRTHPESEDERTSLPEPEMSAEELHDTIADASEIGVSIILIAGGEPLLRPEILDITARFPEVIFPLLTGGLLVDERTMRHFKKQRNVVPVVDLRDYRPGSEEPRGQEIYEHAQELMRSMAGERLFFGTSLMLTRLSFGTLMEESFIHGLMEAGSRLFFFVEHVSREEDVETLTLTPEQRRVRAERLASSWSNLPALFVTFPGEMSSYGGCLAAGRGFVHVSPEGHVQPCPFSPFSDVSLREMPLLEALQSEFLRRIREQESRLERSSQECALWTNRDWLRSLLADPTA